VCLLGLPSALSCHRSDHRRTRKDAPEPTLLTNPANPGRKGTFASLDLRPQRGAASRSIGGLVRNGSSASRSSGSSGERYVLRPVCPTREAANSWHLRGPDPGHPRCDRRMKFCPTLSGKCLLKWQNIVAARTTPTFPNFRSNLILAEAR
jgi:hypothetical protein